MITNKQFAKVGDLNIRFELADYTDAWRTDEPETFLLYSGYCRSMEFWRSWVPLLGRDYRVLRMDPRGYGDTSKPLPGSPISTEILAKDAIGLMDELGIKRVHWAGDSTGGFVGLVAAMNHPDRIASLSLCNTDAKMSGETVSTYALDQADQGAAIEKYGVAEWCRRTLDHRMDTQGAPSGLDAFVPNEMAKTPVHIAVAVFKLFSTGDLTPRLGEIKAPTLLMAGSNCSERRKRQMAEMVSKIPRAKMVLIDGPVSGLHFLAPEAVVGEVRKFLQSNK